MLPHKLLSRAPYPPSQGIPLVPLKPTKRTYILFINIAIGWALVLVEPILGTYFLTMNWGPKHGAQTRSVSLDLSSSFDLGLYWL